MQSKDTVGDFQAVVASGKSGCHVVLLLNDAVELSEGGESSCAHPHDEILIYEAVVFWVNVQLINRLAPVDRLRCFWKMRSVLVGDMGKAYANSSEYKYKYILPIKTAVRFVLLPPGFLNFTCLSVHHAIPFLLNGICVFVPLGSCKTNPECLRQREKETSNIKTLEEAVLRW